MLDYYLSEYSSLSDKLWYCKNASATILKYVDELEVMILLASP